jgi:hypothetical protein
VGDKSTKELSPPWPRKFDLDASATNSRCPLTKPSKLERYRERKKSVKKEWNPCPIQSYNRRSTYFSRSGGCKIRSFRRSDAGGLTGIRTRLAFSLADWVEGKKGKEWGVPRSRGPWTWGLPRGDNVVKGAVLNCRGGRSSGERGSTVARRGSPKAGGRRRRGDGLGFWELFMLPWPEPSRKEGDR